MEAPLLQLHAITKSFAAVRALRGVSFSLHAGEVHALLGENGAGKSTLIKVITGAHAPDGGTLEIGGTQHAHLTPREAHRLGIACIYQQPALFPELSVAENIALALEPPSPWRVVRWGGRMARARELMRRVGAQIDPAIEVSRLSMPEQQLVEIAKALGAGARILIMDEPTASLTQQEERLLLALIRELSAAGVGIIYISHRLDEIVQIADRVTVLRDGESVGTYAIGDITEATLIHAMVGHEMTTIYPPAEAPPGAVVLSIQKLGCASAGVGEASFDLRAGEVFGLSGLVGAGRTELARVLFGLTPAESGAIVLAGQPIRVDSPEAAVAHGIAYVPEDRRRHGVILPMSITANSSLAVLSWLFPKRWMRAAPERALAADFMRDLRIKAASSEAPGASLSGGNQQKVAVARWLATRPKVLILDEPTQGVDIGAKAEIHAIIRRLAADGLAIILISSELPEILGMSDRIGVMRGGMLMAIFTAAEATAPSLMAAALGQAPQAVECGGAPPLSPGRAGRESQSMQPADAGCALPLPRAGLPAKAAEHRRTPQPAAPGGRGTGAFREWSVAVALAVFLAVLAVLAPRFFTTAQLVPLLTAAAPALLTAAGASLVILTRQIDISIGSQFAWCSVLAGLAAAHGWPLPAVCAVAVAVGVALGAINGLLVAALELPSIVVTLASMVTLREALRWWREGEMVRDLPPTFQWFGLSQTAGQWTTIALAAGCFILLALALSRLAGGRFLYAVGSDAEAACLAGLRPRVVTFAAFAAAGALTGLAALLNAVRFADVDPKSGQGLEMQAIAAAVVGGIAIAGGRGRLWGVLPGLLILAIIGPALVFTHTPPQWERALQGAIILLAVGADGWRNRRKTA
jgi:rhamnose transport system ATP-binding protein